MPTAEDFDPLIQTMKRVASTLEQSGIPFALAGSMAAYARGGHAPDHDVDFLIKEDDAEKALTALAEVGFRPEVPPEGWLVKVYEDTNLVDLIFRPCQRPVSDETLAHTDVLSVNALHMPVLSATELMIHKILSYGPHYCDMTRAIPLARSLREQIDWDRVYDEVCESPYAYAFLVLVDRLGVICLADITGDATRRAKLKEVVG
jgi:hypothetical protein